MLMLPGDVNKEFNLVTFIQIIHTELINNTKTIKYNTVGDISNLVSRLL